ncbi:MAG TPA: hypothetical protein VFZ53_01760, partial [Polyangiaceae bacterium]
MRSDDGGFVELAGAGLFRCGTGRRAPCGGAETSGETSGAFDDSSARTGGVSGTTTRVGEGAGNSGTDSGAAVA